MMYGFWDIRHDGQEFYVILGHFLPFDPPNTPKILNFLKMKKTRTYYHFKLVYHKWQPYDVWLLRYGTRQNIFSFWTIFCPFTPLTTQKINFEKMKKMPGDIILHMCTIHENHMMYGSWDMEHNRQNFVSLDHFWPFYHLKQTRKPRFEKTKKCMEMQSISKIVIICYTVPGIWHVMDVFII